MECKLVLITYGPSIGTKSHWAWWPWKLERRIDTDARYHRGNMAEFLVLFLVALFVLFSIDCVLCRRCFIYAI